jgi:hypothetical protein
MLTKVTLRGIRVVNKKNLTNPPYDLLLHVIGAVLILASMVANTNSANRPKMA